MLLDKDQSALLLIDIQEKLSPYVMKAEALLQRCLWLGQLANTLNVPLIVSEQYPKGLGQTMPVLREELGLSQCIEKIHFSCYREPSFVSQWQGLAKKQVVIAGIETHVCVLQTALDLLEAGYAVFVVVDAVSSRFELDHHYGLKRMKQNGVQLLSSEMVFFEWLRRAGTPEFKELSQTFLPRA